jgi:hypothetical protein
LLVPEDSCIGEHRDKYSEAASKKVAKAMHERKRGTLKSGRSGKT